jgi:hypothetical protein
MKTIITTILAELKSDITNLVDRIVAAIEKKTEKALNHWDIEMIELNVILDMIKSVEKYTANDDVLVSVSSSVSVKGNIEINAVIERNGVQYRLTTEVIYAGGYNIQKLHYRYITNSQLPKTNNSTITTEYAEKIKKMTKIERLQTEIKTNQIWMARYQESLVIKENVKPENVVEHMKSENSYWFSERTAWNKLSEQAHKNWESEEKYNQYAIDILEDKIKDFYQDIRRLKSNIKDVQKVIAKLEAKIAAL